MANVKVFADKQINGQTDKRTGPKIYAYRSIDAGGGGARTKIHFVKILTGPRRRMAFAT